MSAKKETFAFEQIDEARRLVRDATEVIRLCAFACEARRTLQDIDFACNLVPDVNTTLNRLVDARYQWTTHNDNVEIVLTQVANQLDEVHERLEAGS